jgi:ATP-dependent protease ClpP protease subunit
MKEILIDGEIGYDWWDGSGNTGKTVAAQLEGIADGEEVSVTINSPGGSVYEGAVIFNLLRETAKTHPMSVRINSIAMSMGSYIALAARTVDKNAKVTVTDNSILMIHNPWIYTYGDYRDLKKQSEYLEKLAAMYGSVHSAVSGKADADIRAAMDEETFYVGKEIVDAGFANDYEAITEQTEPEEEAFGRGRDGKIINAKLRFDAAMQKAREAQNKKEAKNDLQKAAAALASQADFTTQTFGALPQDKNKKPESAQTKNSAACGSRGGTMKPEELLAQDKACYEAVFALGEKAALEKERQRVAAHIKRGEKIGAMDIAMKHITGGKNVTDDDVNEEYFNAALDKRRLNARLADNPPPFTTDDGSEGEDDAALDAAFAAGTR